MNLFTFAPTVAIGTLTQGPNTRFQGKPLSISLQAVFTYGSGGATFDAYIVSSLDGGKNWFDIANFHFTTASAWFAYNLNSQTPVTAERTPALGALTANTSLDGLWGAMLGVYYKSSGTYAGTTLSIDLATDTTP